MLCCSILGAKPHGNLCGAAEGSFAGADCAPGLCFEGGRGVSLRLCCCLVGFLHPFSAVPGSDLPSAGHKEAFLFLPEAPGSIFFPSGSTWKGSFILLLSFCKSVL